MTLDTMLLVGSVVLLVAVLSARLGSRFGLPSLLLFLALGSVMGLLGFRLEDAGFAHALGFAALVFILGEGGLATRWADIRGALSVAGLLATVGVAVSIGATAAFGHLLLGLSLPTALLLGAVMSPTDSAAVFAVLRNVPLPARIRSVLEGESGLNDAPIVLMVSAGTAWALGELPEGGPVALGGLIVVELIGGLLLGAVVGYLGSRMLQGVALPASGLYPLATVSVIVLSYGVGVAIHLSGFAAVYVCALILGNSSLPHRQATRSFAEGVGWVSQIGLFVMLGMMVDFSRITPIAVIEGLLVGGFVTFVARPLSVMLCSLGSGLTFRQQSFVSWAGLRGAVPIIMATVPLAAAAPDAHLIFDAVFVFVVVFTFLQAPSLPAVARRLGVSLGAEPVDIEVEVAPLDKIQADFMQVRVPRGSKLHGVTVKEMRLPKLAVIAVIIREGEPRTPSDWERIQEGDELLIVVPSRRRREVEERFRSVGRGGRLARWWE